MSKLITVFCATGRQGKSVSLSLLENGYKVRALTRNANSKEAKLLIEKGCEVVEMDMDKQEDLEKSIAGSYGVFAITNYWGLLAENAETAFDREVAQGKAIGDVCKKSGVKHLIFSSLEHVQEVFGKHCPHFDTKGVVEKYLDEIKVPNTAARVAFYYDNFCVGGMAAPKKQEDGTFNLTLPMDGPMDGIRVGDLGDAVVTMFNSPEEYIGQKICLSGDSLTIEEYTSIMSEVTGRTCTYTKVKPEEFENLPFLGAGAMTAMFVFYSSGCVQYSPEVMRKLNPKTASFRQFAEENKDRLLA